MSEFHFGLGHGWLPKRAAVIAKHHGAALVNFTEPQCSCGRGCSAGTCKASRRHWFSGPNQGEPHDKQLARTVLQAIKDAGL